MDRRVPLFDIESAKLTHAGHVNPDSTWTMPVHSHTVWEFVYFERGSGRIELPGGTLSPQPYHLVVYPPGLPHAESANPMDPEETTFLVVDVKGSPPAGAHLLLPDIHGDIAWLCQRILAEFRALGATPLAETYTRAFLLLVERVWGRGVPIRHDSVDIAVQFLHTNYSTDITLDDLAGAACVSRTYLAHSFRSRLGISPLRYLQQVRIETAKHLLATTLTPIHVIATGVGFADPLYFSRAFKTATGLSPKAFRQRANMTTTSIFSAVESISANKEPGV